MFPLSLFAHWRTLCHQISPISLAMGKVISHWLKHWYHYHWWEHNASFTSSSTCNSHNHIYPICCLTWRVRILVDILIKLKGKLLKIMWQSCDCLAFDLRNQQVAILLLIKEALGDYGLASYWGVIDKTLVFGQTSQHVVKQWITLYQTRSMSESK